jgi:flavin-dependent dehydrogenase
MSSEREVDVLIAGAGPAGMTAALVASLQGLDVLLCEKSGQVGGTGATSAGTLWIPGNHQSRKAGFDDSAEKAQDYLDALICGRPICKPDRSRSTIWKTIAM